MEFNVYNMKEPLSKEAIKEIEYKKNSIILLKQAGLELDDWELYKLYKKQTKVETAMMALSFFLLGTFTGLLMSL